MQILLHSETMIFKHIINHSIQNLTNVRQYNKLQTNIILLQRTYRISLIESVSNRLELINRLTD